MVEEIEEKEGKREGSGGGGGGEEEDEEEEEEEEDELVFLSVSRLFASTCNGSLGLPGLRLIFNLVARAGDKDLLLTI